MNALARCRALALPSALALLLAGCATGMDKNQCAAADWRTVGFEDGLRGASADRIGVHRTACAKFQVTPDLPAYLEGRERGLQQYCQVANGFRVGLNGAGYDSVCTPAQEPAFLAAYRQGREIYDARSALRHTQSQLRSARDGLARTETAIANTTTEIALPQTPAERRGVLAAELVRLAQERANLVRRIDDLALRTQQLADDVRALERRSPFPV
jgi:hypothetical protein